MSRTPEVEAAMAFCAKGHIMGPEEYFFCQQARTLAAEIERLEARVKELEAARQDLLGKIVDWQEGFDKDFDRIAELEAQNAKLRAALEELKRNVIEVVLPNAKNITWDAAQMIMWSNCVEQTDKALADTKGTA